MEMLSGGKIIYLSSGKYCEKNWRKK